MRTISLGQRTPARGFTLVEVLVVLAVLGMLVIGLAQGVRFGQRAWGTETALLDRVSGMDAVQRFLRVTIEAASAVEGDQASLKLVGRMPDSLGLPGLYDIEIGSETPGRVMLHWKRHWGSSERPGAAGTALLADDVASLDFSYLTAGTRLNSDGSMTSVQNWKPDANGHFLPSLVRVVLHTMGTAPSEGVELLAAPGASLMAKPRPTKKALVATP